MKIENYGNLSSTLNYVNLVNNEMVVRVIPFYHFLIISFQISSFLIPIL